VGSPGGYAERQDLNYLGQLLLVGNTQTPALSMLGGMGNGVYKTVAGFTYPVAQPYSLNAASQDVVSEDDAAYTGATKVTYTRGQDTNYIQIHHKAYGASYAKLSAYGELGAVSNVVDSVRSDNPVQNEVAFQRVAAMKQLANDLEFTIHQGTAVAPSAGNVASKTRGFLEAISTNAVAGGSAYLTKSMIDELLRTMADNGALFENMIMFANSFQKQKITSIYGYAPEDRNVGGVNIKQIETDFGIIGVVYSPKTLVSAVEFIDMSYVELVY